MGGCCKDSCYIESWCPKSQEVTATLHSNLGATTHLKLGGGVVGSGISPEAVNSSGDTNKLTFILDLGKNKNSSITHLVPKSASRHPPPTGHEACLIPLTVTALTDLKAACFSPSPPSIPNLLHFLKCPSNDREAQQEDFVGTQRW